MTTLVRTAFVVVTFFVSTLFVDGVASTAGAEPISADGPASFSTSSTSSTSLHRNTVACDYVDWTYSGLFQHPPKGYRPSAFVRMIEGAASATLRREVR